MGVDSAAQIATGDAARPVGGMQNGSRAALPARRRAGGRKERRPVPTGSPADSSLIERPNFVSDAGTELTFFGSGIPRYWHKEYPHVSATPQSEAQPVP